MSSNDWTERALGCFMAICAGISLLAGVKTIIYCVATCGCPK